MIRYVLASLLLAAPLVARGKEGPHCYVLHLSSIKLPRDAKVLTVNLSVGKEVVVMVTDLPDGWWLGTSGSSNGTTYVTLSFSAKGAKKVGKFTELKAFDNSIWVRPELGFDQSQDAQDDRRKITVSGDIEYALPGDKQSSNQKFSDAEVQREFIP